MRTLALAMTAILFLLPAASALPNPLDGSELTPPPDLQEGDCPASGCPITSPDPNEDPLPLGRDVTKAHVGGECEEGAYATVCETEECKTTYGVAAPCEETSTCYFHARTVCVIGVNQRTISPAISYYATRLRHAQELWPGLPSFHVVVEESVGVGGYCGERVVTLSCSYTPAPGDCTSFDPDDMFAPQNCNTERAWCVTMTRVTVDQVLSEGCTGFIAKPPEIACLVVPGGCEIACAAADDASITICRTRS